MPSIASKHSFIVVLTAICLATSADPCEGRHSEGDWREHLKVINDFDVSQAERLAAVEAIIALNDAAALRPVFKLLTQAVGDWDISQPIGRVPEGVYAPSVQIPTARLRVFEHLARSAEPEATRKRIFAELFDEWETEFEFRLLSHNAIYNPSPQLEEILWKLFADRENEPSIRLTSAGTLLNVTHPHSFSSFRHYSHRIIEFAWEERGSEVATGIGGRGGGKHPLQNALLLDWYDRERNPETRKSHISMEDMADKFDRSFNNITGLYKDRDERMDSAIAVVRQRRALEMEARETGDDTKLREFEAELAAKEQAELEERIARIDAWIAANRERLEREAAEYQPQTRERTRQPAPQP